MNLIKCILYIAAGWSVTENVVVEQKRKQRGQFDKNSRYLVLLFYRLNRKGDAQQIEKELVSLG